MNNFTFLPPTFKDLAEASHKAEAQTMGDPLRQSPSPGKPPSSSAHFTGNSVPCGLTNVGI